MEKGYWLAEGLLATDKIKDILEDIEILFRQFSKNCGDQAIMEVFRNDFEAFMGCAHLCRKLPQIYELAGSLQQTLIENCGLRMPVLNTKPIISFSSRHTAKKEEYWKIGPHQDWASNLGSTNGITVWIPLQDVDDDLGPLQVIPRSHLFGYMEHEGVPPILKSDLVSRVLLDNKWHSVPMKAGDVLFFRTLLIHQSGENKTNDKIRKSIHLRYNDALEQSFIDRKYPLNRTGD
jgi:phytanoyl-CoA hydroxylase